MVELECVDVTDYLVELIPVCHLETRFAHFTRNKYTKPGQVVIKPLRTSP